MCEFIRWEKTALVTRPTTFVPARTSIPGTRALSEVNGAHLEVGFRRNDFGREFAPPAWNSILNPQNFPLAFIHRSIIGSERALHCFRPSHFNPKVPAIDSQSPRAEA